MNISGRHKEILNEFKEDRFDLFYRLVWPGVLLYANKMLGAQHELLAEDCVQDAVLQAWKRKAEFGSTTALKAFLFTAVKNNIISMHRKHAAQIRYIDKLENQTENAFINSLIDQEARAMLFNAINELPDKIRQVFEMNFIEGLKIADIADKMHVTERSVKNYKAQGLELLRQKLDPSLFILLLASIS